ncbi:MAG: type III pantothenate kinase [Flavobacteriaceae bacterium]
MNLIIDVGNTRVKAAVYEKDTCLEQFVFSVGRIISETKKILKKHQINSGIISSVAKISSKKKEKMLQLVNFIELNAQTKVPFKNLYATPKTLGVDRIALVSAAVNQYPQKNVLIIDAGTCVTFDFVNNNKEYLGGAISLGVKMRFKSLNAFTSNLPLIEKNYPNHFIGNSTTTSIQSGVINGICKEIDGVINQYNQQFQDLTVVLTGGDTYFLAKQLKSSIFANPNFILEGLNTILIYNKDE